MSDEERPDERRNRLDGLAIEYALKVLAEDDDEQQLGWRTW